MEWTVAIGVDTHKEVHVAVALDRLGAQLDSREIARRLRGTEVCSRGRRSSGYPLSWSRAPEVTARDWLASSRPPGLTCSSVSVRVDRNGGEGRAI